MSSTNKIDRNDLVAYWSIPLNDGVHIVEFEHGKNTGKRVLRIDGKVRFLLKNYNSVNNISQEILRKDWMFKLVGDIKFSLGKQEAKCELHVDPIPPFSFQYSLWVDGKSIEKFAEKQFENVKYWSVIIDSKRHAIALTKQTLEMWVNGQLTETETEFTENGTEMKFNLDACKLKVCSFTSENNKKILYNLYVNDRLIIEDSHNVKS